MLTLSAKIRKVVGKKVKTLCKKGILPAVLYGPEIENLNLEINLKEFEKIYREAGGSSLIKLKVGNEGKNKEFLVLIQDVQLHPLSDAFLHVDFYQPKLKEEITVTIPIIFEGEAPAVKELGGTLVKNISEVEIKALAQNLPRELKVNIESLKTFDDNIKISDLKIPAGVKILRNPEEIVVSVSPPEKVEEELLKPIEEKVEEVEKVGEKEKIEKEEEKSTT